MAADEPRRRRRRRNIDGGSMDAMGDPYRFSAGSTPLLVSLPHDSTYIPEELARRMTPAALKTADTDWHVARLYDAAAGMGASILVATHSRYVVDLNRDPEDRQLYPGMDNTEVCPLLTFDMEPIYRPGAEPDAAEVRDRVARYWRPYHDRIDAELGALRARHGLAILFDGHTIRSQVARFFEGELPDLNLGTANGASIDPELGERIYAVLEASDYSAVRDGRFTGGYITRHYGAPARNIHTVQLELTWRTYMDESEPFAYLPGRAAGLKKVLERMLAEILAWTAENTANLPE
jgi:N-formylglutamate deformylase